MIHLRSRKKSSNWFLRHVFFLSLFIVPPERSTSRCGKIHVGKISIKDPLARMWFHVAHFALSLWPHHKFIGAYYVRLLDRFSLWHWPVPERSKASLFLDGFMARMGNGKMILCKAILHIHQMGLFMSYERRRVYLYCLLRGSSLDTWHQLWALKCFAGMIPSIGS